MNGTMSVHMNERLYSTFPTLETAYKKKAYEAETSVHLPRMQNT